MTFKTVPRRVQAIGVGAMQLGVVLLRYLGGFAALCRDVAFRNDTSSVPVLATIESKEFIALHHALHRWLPSECQPSSSILAALLTADLAIPCVYAPQPSWLSHAVRSYTNLAKQGRRVFPRLHSGNLGDIFESIAVIARGSGIPRMLRLSQASESRICCSICPTIRLRRLVAA